MKEGGLPVWVEYAKLAVSAFIPVAVVFLGLRLDASRTINQELVKKRLAIYDSVAPRINDIFVFYQGIGHWAELNPSKVIENKRVIDKIVYVNQFLFSKATFRAYKDFERQHFELYSEANRPAALRIDLGYLRPQLGEGFKPEWNESVEKRHLGDRVEQNRAYQSLMKALADEIKGS
jgi:hypothetical protein